MRVHANPFEHRAVIAREAAHDERGLGLLLVVKLLDAVEVLLHEVVGEVVPLVGVGDDVLDVEERRSSALVEPVEELGDVVHRSELVREVR